MSLRTVVLLWGVSAAVAGCERGAPPAPPAPAEAPRGAGLPFEAGADPDIREVETANLAEYLAADPWCSRADGGRRVRFAPGGDYTARVGEREARGTWRVEQGELRVLVPQEPARPVDARAATVNGRPVLLLDGRLYGRCEL
jgi:hypothetical protein